MTTRDPRACINCRHYRDYVFGLSGSGHPCARDAGRVEDMVTGRNREERSGAPFCEDERGDRPLSLVARFFEWLSPSDRCGPEAKYFIKRPANQYPGWSG